MTPLQAKREEIAALIARELGLGDLEALGPKEREEVDAVTAQAIEASGGAVADEANPVLANLRLRQLLSDHADLAALESDERDTRLAEKGEVFSREDDA